MSHSLGTNNQLVVYYWTNLALTEQGSGLDQQKEDFSIWLDKKRKENNLAQVEIKAEFIDTHLKRTKPKFFPELRNAVNFCVNNNTKLVIVKLDGLISQKEFADLLATDNLDFVCVDKNLVTPQVLSVVKQYVQEQSKQHGASIKRGLKLTNSKLGNPNAAQAISTFNKIKTENSVLFALLLQPIIAQYQEQGLSQRKIVAALNDADILAPEGGKWVLSQLQKVLKRIETNTLAIELSNEIEKNNYAEYSAVDLSLALNQSGFKPTKNNIWDEDILKAVKNRNKTIVNVLGLYKFMYEWSPDINNYIAEGKTLDQIAAEFNKQGLEVPEALTD